MNNIPVRVVLLIQPASRSELCKLNPFPTAAIIANELGKVRRGYREISLMEERLLQ